MDAGVFSQMYGRYTQELGVYAKEEATRLKESGEKVSQRSRTLEHDNGRCAKCKSQTTQPAWNMKDKQQVLLFLFLKLVLVLLFYRKPSYHF